LKKKDEKKNESETDPKKKISIEDKNYWTKVKQADYLGVELGTNIQILTNLWNQSTSRFLRNYVYTRIGSADLFIPSHLVKHEPGKKPESKSKLLNLVATFSVSAVWHGLYFGYFQMFVIAAFFAHFQRLWHDAIRPIVFSDSENINEPKKSFKLTLYLIISWIAVHSFFAANMIGFHVYSYEDIFAWHSKTKWIGVIGSAAYVVVCLLLSLMKPKKKKE